jgi:hypothetical protein
MGLLKNTFDLIVFAERDITPTRHVGLDLLDPSKIVAQVLPIALPMLTSIALFTRRYDIPQPMLTEAAPIYRNTMVHMVGLRDITAGAAISEIVFGFLPITLVERLLTKPAKNKPDQSILRVADLDAAEAAISRARHGSGPRFITLSWRRRKRDLFCREIIAERVTLSVIPLAACPESPITDRISRNPIPAVILGVNHIGICEKGPSQPEYALGIVSVHKTRQFSRLSFTELKDFADVEFYKFADSHGAASPISKRDLALPPRIGLAVQSGP